MLCYHKNYSWTLHCHLSFKEHKKYIFYINPHIHLLLLFIPLCGSRCSSCIISHLLEKLLLTFPEWRSVGNDFSSVFVFLKNYFVFNFSYICWTKKWVFFSFSTLKMCLHYFFGLHHLLRSLMYMFLFSFGCF